MWLDYAFQELFDLRDTLSGVTADLYFDTISEQLRSPRIFVRGALFETVQY